MKEVQITKDLPNKTLIIEYVVDAPTEKVWRAYSEKELFEQWWGPEGWDTTTKVFDFRPGGRIHYGMKCVDENQKEWFGQESWGIMEIQTLEEGKGFTGLDHFSDADGVLNAEMPALIVTNEFRDEDGATRIVCRCVAASAEQIEELIKMGMVEGYQGQLHKLDRLVAQA